MKRLKCALLGAGRIAQNYAQVLSGQEDLELTGVVDCHVESAEALAQQHNSRSYRSFQAMLNHVRDIDLAVICTPPSTHHHLAITCLREGLHVLCEKPFTIHSADAREMIEEARKQDRLLTMASKFRYVQDITTAKEHFESGLLGEVVCFENVFAAYVDMQSRWNSDPRISGGGVLIDNGAHSLDVTRYVFGPLTEIQVLEGKRAQNLAVEDTVQINVRTVTRILGRIDLSWSINKIQDAFLSIYGNKGTLHVGWKESRYKLHGENDWVRFGSGYNKLAAFQAQVANFAAAIRGEEPLLITAQDGLASVLAIESAYQSLRQFQWATIPGIPCGCGSDQPIEHSVTTSVP